MLCRTVKLSAIAVPWFGVHQPCLSVWCFALGCVAFYVSFFIIHPWIVVIVYLTIVAFTLNRVYNHTLYALFSFCFSVLYHNLHPPPTFLTMLYSLLLNRNFSVLPFALFLAQNTQTYTTDHLYLFPSSVAPCDAFHYKLNHFFFHIRKISKAWLFVCSTKSFVYTCEHVRGRSRYRDNDAVSSHIHQSIKHNKYTSRDIFHWKKTFIFDIMLENFDNNNKRNYDEKWPS